MMNTTDPEAINLKIFGIPWNFIWICSVFYPEHTFVIHFINENEIKNNTEMNNCSEYFYYLWFHLW